MAADQLDRLSAALSHRYRIERELGRGGMAVVYLALDLKHERDVAIKVLRPDVAAALGPERFLREIKLTAAGARPGNHPRRDAGAGHLAGTAVARAALRPWLRVRLLLAPVSSRPPAAYLTR